MDEIFKFASEDSGFAIKNPVKRELASRDVVQKYVESRLSEDEDAKRLERSEIVLKKFGLLPRDFDLHTFLVGLLREQVAGYYDVRTKTIYLLDWLDADAQRPVLAHELTHALQDQNYDLKNWSNPGERRAKAGNKSERFEYDDDEESMARNAVAEGQAMVTLIDYMLQPTGHTLADSPQFGRVMRDAMGKATDSPMLERAPLMLRESLLYPYRDGLDFEQELLSAGGKSLAFNGAFKQPPQNTHEILDPADYLKRAVIPPLPIPDLRDALGGPRHHRFVLPGPRLQLRVPVERRHPLRPVGADVGHRHRHRRGARARGRRHPGDRPSALDHRQAHARDAQARSLGAAGNRRARRRGVDRGRGR